MKKLMSLLVAVVLVTFMYSCTEQTEAEQAEQEIEQAVEETGEAIEQAVDGDE